MSRKKKHEHVNHERWLVSYADFITLLFAFFVVLFASSQSDKKKTQQMALALQSAFAQYGVFEAHSKSPALAPSAGSGEKAAPLAKPISSISESATQSAQDEALKLRIFEAVGDRPLNPSTQTKPNLNSSLAAAKNAARDAARNSMSFRTTKDGLVLSLRDAGFFPSGSADLTPEATTLLNTVAANLPASAMRVEGHTDNAAIHNTIFKNNWDLSTARATAIARILLERSMVAPADLAIAGYGEYHPIASNLTEEGRAKNRRVDIVLLRR